MKIPPQVAALLLLTFPALAEESPSQLTLVIRHRYEGKPIEFAQPTLTTPSGEQISITRLAYILSEPSLKPAGDEQWLHSRDWFAPSTAVS